MNDRKAIPEFTVSAWACRLDAAWRQWAERERPKTPDKPIVPDSPIADEPIIVSER